MNREDTALLHGSVPPSISSDRSQRDRMADTIAVQRLMESLYFPRWTIAGNRFTARTKALIGGLFYPRADSTSDETISLPGLATPSLHVGCIG